jgi:hypothetical protein
MKPSLADDIFVCLLDICTDGAMFNLENGVANVFYVSSQI